MRFEPGVPRRLLAEMQKSADLIAQFRQGLIVGKGKFFSMTMLIISYYDVMEKHLSHPEYSAVFNRARDLARISHHCLSETQPPGHQPRPTI